MDGSAAVKENANPRLFSTIEQQQDRHRIVLDWTQMGTFRQDIIPGSSSGNVTVVCRDSKDLDNEPTTSSSSSNSGNNNNIPKIVVPTTSEDKAILRVITDCSKATKNGSGVNLLRKAGLVVPTYKYAAAATSSSSALTPSWCYDSSQPMFAISTGPDGYEETEKQGGGRRRQPQQLGSSSSSDNNNSIDDECAAAVIVPAITPKKRRNDDKDDDDDGKEDNNVNLDVDVDVVMNGDDNDNDDDDDDKKMNAIDDDNDDDCDDEDGGKKECSTTTTTPISYDYDESIVTAEEIFDIIRTIQDPEHPHSLEQLGVVSLEQVKIIRPTMITSSKSLATSTSTTGTSSSKGDENTKNSITNTKKTIVTIQFTPTIPHCSMATLIGLCLRVKLFRSLPITTYKVNVNIEPGTHVSERAINKQLRDKERVRAALENKNLSNVVDKCILEGIAASLV